MYHTHSMLVTDTSDGRAQTYLGCDLHEVECVNEHTFADMPPINIERKWQRKCSKLVTVCVSRARITYKIQPRFYFKRWS